MAMTSSFMEGTTLVQSESQSSTVALMCGEKGPADWHRTLLVGRRLHNLGRGVRHILADRPDSLTTLPTPSHNPPVRCLS